MCVLPSTYSWLSCCHCLPITTCGKASAVHRKLKQSISAGRSTASFLDIMWLLRLQDEKQRSAKMLKQLCCSPNLRFTLHAN